MSYQSVLNTSRSYGATNEIVTVYRPDGTPVRFPFMAAQEYVKKGKFSPDPPAPPPPVAVVEAPSAPPVTPKPKDHKRAKAWSF